MESLYSLQPDHPGTIRHRRAALLDEVELADPAAFHLPRRELRQMDPQHRLLLECAWHAFEDAGIPFSALCGSDTGVFVGINSADFQKLLSRNFSTLDGYALLGTPLHLAANRISYAFDLRGPSICVSVGCTASTVALHQACQSLQAGEVELALAGGSELMLSPDISIFLSQAGVLSPQGQCRTLDARADGYVRGEGVGLVALKLVSNLAPKDRVYALIRGSAVNSNGHNEWIMAPSAAAQQEVIERACARAGINPGHLEYVEMHGSAFPRGDAAEAIAIGKALGNPSSRPVVRLGAVSNNLGYQGSAVGIMQLIKLCLSLHHKTFLPTIHAEQPSPLIPFSELGLKIQTELEPWLARQDGEPRRAGTISTSVGGVNAFVVLEAAPEVLPKAETGQAGDSIPTPFLLVLSVHTPALLAQRARQLHDFLFTIQENDPSLADICYTAALRRQHQRYRAAVMAQGRSGLLGGLAALGADASRNFWSEPGCCQAEMEAVRSFLEGGELSRKLFAAAQESCVSLPVYLFQREALWPDWLTPDVISRSSVDSSASPLKPEHAPPVRLPTRHGAQRSADILAFLRRELAQVLEIAPEQVDTRERTLFELGLNSLGVNVLRERIARAFGVSIMPTTFFEHPRLDPLAAWLSERLATEAARDNKDDSVQRAQSASEDNLASQIAQLSDEETLALLQKKLAEIESLGE
jgi:acyl transferase domain-containing protein